MSQATQCDRCKKYFRVEEQGDNEESVKLHDVTAYTRDNRINHTFSWGVSLIDLCPTCAKVFRIFMDGFDILPVKHIEDRKKDTADSEKDGV